MAVAVAVTTLPVTTSAAMEVVECARTARVDEAASGVVVAEEGEKTLLVGFKLLSATEDAWRFL